MNSNLSVKQIGINEYTFGKARDELFSCEPDATLCTHFIINSESEILKNKQFIDEYNKPYKMRVTYQILEQQIERVKKECEWKIGQLNFIEKSEDYEILDNETNLKVHYHRKGFIEGLQWYLKTLENTVSESKQQTNRNVNDK